jgi:hypothetical protein
VRLVELLAEYCLSGRGHELGSLTAQLTAGGLHVAFELLARLAHDPVGLSGGLVAGLFELRGRVGLGGR